MIENYLTEYEKIIASEIERKFNIVPYLVIYSKSEYGTLLSITFWYESDLEEFLKKVNLGNSCDLSGIHYGPTSILISEVTKVRDVLSSINVSDEDR